MEKLYIEVKKQNKNGVPQLSALALFFKSDFLVKMHEYEISAYICKSAALECIISQPQLTAQNTRVSCLTLETLCSLCASPCTGSGSSSLEASNAFSFYICYGWRAVAFVSGDAVNYAAGGSATKCSLKVTLLIITKTLQT